MPASRATCPICQQADQVNKVSSLYLFALQSQRPGANTGSATEAVIRKESLRLDGLQPEDLSRLGKRLAPPSTPKEMPTRPLHPDMVVLVFSLVLPIFLLGIRSSQPVMFAPALVVLAVCYAAYFFLRRAAIAKFERQQAKRRASADRVQLGIQRWMSLYYCTRDDVVFEPGSRESAPADQIAGYLLR